MTAAKDFGLVGLGRMGGGLALQALEKGFRVVGFSKGGAGEELVRAGLIEVGSLAELASRLTRPRAVFLYIPAGRTVDAVLDQLAEVLSPEDVIVDGGNSYWGDSIRRARRLESRGLWFVDLGTSGGIEGARSGACFMAGGRSEAVARVEPVLQQLSVPGGYVHAGPSGAGHFTKLVHNGIEFGMLQAIGEGVALLEAYGHDLPVAEILRSWRHGSVIRSWLVDLMEAGYRASDGLAEVPTYVDDTGEVNWLIADALRMEVPIPAIAQSVMELLVSRDGRGISARSIEVMRHGFGGHAFGKTDADARERHEGRVDANTADSGPGG